MQLRMSEGTQTVISTLMMMVWATAIAGGVAMLTGSIEEVGQYVTGGVMLVAAGLIEFALWALFLGKVEVETVDEEREEK